MSEASEHRDESGRFTPGNPGGPGCRRGSRRRELLATVDDVLTPQRLRAVLGILLKLVVERQDVGAAKLLLDRGLGKVRSEPLPDIDLDLPNGLQSAGDVVKAANALLTGTASGAIAPEDAQRMAALVEAARKAVETQDLERRIAALEEQRKREERR